MSDTLKRTEEWFTTARPSSAPNTFSVQFGVHCEEMAETLEAIEPLDEQTGKLMDEARASLRKLSDALKSGQALIVHDDIARTSLLDGLCDTIVTSVGCAHALGMDIVGAMGEVNSSNFSKFEAGAPVFKENGKIGKGKDYRPPNLRPFIIKK